MHTNNPRVAFATMSTWARNIPELDELLEYKVVVHEYTKHAPSLLLNPTGTNLVFEKLHDEWGGRLRPLVPARNEKMTEGVFVFCVLEKKKTNLIYY